MSLIGALKGVANTAVGLAPYAQQAMLAQKQRDDADKQRMLAQLHQMSQDSTASVNATAAYGLNAAQQAHLGAQTDALRHPATSLTYKPDADGNLYGLPTKMSGAPSAPNPLTAGPKVIGDGSEPQQPTQQPTQQPGITPIATGVKGAQPLVKVQDVPGGPVRWVARDKAENTNAPTSAEPLTKTVDPTTGAVTYTRTREAAGMNAPVAAGAGGGRGGALSGQTMQTLGRLGMSYNDLEQAVAQMEAYENKPGNLAKQTPFKQAAGAVAEAHPATDAHGLWGAANNGLGAFFSAKAGEWLGQDDPDFRTYLMNKQRVGTAFTELLPRPNQQLLQLEKGLSGADVSWNPELIKAVQGRRRGGLDVLKNILSQQGMLDDKGQMTGRAGGRGGGPASAPANVPHPPNANDPGPGPISLGGAPARPTAPDGSDLHVKYDAAVAHLKKQGKTDAQIAQMLPPPPED